MRLMEVGTKALGAGNKEDAYAMFEKSYDLYSLFWGLNMHLIDLGGVREQIPEFYEAVIVKKDDISEDDLMNLALDAGAEDVKTSGDVYEVITNPDMAELDAVKKAIEAKGITPVSADLTMIPDTDVAISDEHTAETLLKMLDALDEHDDTKNVYDNSDIPEDIVAKLEA
jgi:hypothetical protein